MRNRLLPLLAGALAVAALASPLASSAEQYGFELGEVEHPQTGVVTIRVRVSSGGEFAATANSMRTARAKGKEAGGFTLRLRLTKRGLERLSGARGRQLRLEVEFAFTPSAGQPRTTSKKLIFRVVKKK